MPPLAGTTALDRCVMGLSPREAMGNEPIQGDEQGTYGALGRARVTERGMAYGRRRLWSRRARSSAPLCTKSLSPMAMGAHWSEVSKTATNLPPKGVGGQEHVVSKAGDAPVSGARGSSVRPHMVNPGLGEP